MSSLRAVGVLILCAAGAAAAIAQTATPTATPRAFRPVTDAMLRNPDAGDWLMWRRTWNSWGYSPLDQIDKRNVGKLTKEIPADAGAGQVVVFALP